MTKCRVCANTNLNMFLSLGQMPLANSFVTSNEISFEEKKYPLDVYFCNSCSLVQVIDIVPPEVMFTDYPYVTGTSQTMKNNLSELADKASTCISLDPSDLVVDIGSNDGTLLSYFKEAGFRTLGVEPASNIAKLASDNGIETIQAFFTQDTCFQILKSHGKAKIITGTNVFAHVDDINGFINCTKRLLHPDGMLIIEVPYLPDMLNNLEFDTIYHEHLSYFSLSALNTLFRNHNMSIVKVDRLTVHGGSIRVYIASIREQRCPYLQELLDFETDIGIPYIRIYEKFAEEVNNLKSKLRVMLNDLKHDGKRITGYGAPAKGNILLNYCNIDNTILDCIFDNTPFKQDLFTPGTHIPVISDSKFQQTNPDYCLLLAWNYEHEILEKEKEYLQNGGSFIIPIPYPRLISAA